MILARSGRQDKEALALARTSAEWLEKFHAGPADKPDAPAILVTYLNVADQEMLGQQYDDALNLCHRALEIAGFFNNKRYLASFLWVSADIFRGQGNLEEALKEVRESIRMLQPSGHGVVEQGLLMNFIYAQIREGKILGEDGAINLGKRPEAVAVLHNPFETADKLVHQDAHDENARGRLASAGITMADILRESEPARALDVYDHVFRHVAEIKNNASYRRYEVSTLAGSSYSLRRLGRSAEARRRIDGAFERLRQLKDYPAEEIALGLEVDETLGALADWETARGNLARAIEVYEELIKKVSAAHPEPDVNLSDAVNMSRLYAAIAGVHRRAQHAEVASTWDSLRLDLWRRWNAKLPHNAFVSRQLEEAKTPRS
jgi:tetratricopeptide (TPR) repeat protein